MEPAVAIPTPDFIYEGFPISWEHKNATYIFEYADGRKFGPCYYLESPLSWNKEHDRPDDFQEHARVVLDLFEVFPPAIWFQVRCGPNQPRFFDLYPYDNPPSVRPSTSFLIEGDQMWARYSERVLALDAVASGGFDAIRQPVNVSCLAVWYQEENKPFSRCFPSENHPWLFSGLEVFVLVSPPRSASSGGDGDSPDSKGSIGINQAGTDADLS